MESIWIAKWKDGTSRLFTKKPELVLGDGGDWYVIELNYDEILEGIYLDDKFFPVLDYENSPRKIEIPTVAELAIFIGKLLRAIDGGLQGQNRESERRLVSDLLRIMNIFKAEALARHQKKIEQRQLGLSE